MMIIIMQSQKGKIINSLFVRLAELEHHPIIVIPHKLKSSSYKLRNPFWFFTESMLECFCCMQFIGHRCPNCLK